MMKQIRSIVGLAILLAAVSAYAEIQQTIQVKVAFPFVAGGKMFPAADYRVRIEQPTGLVTLTAPGIHSATLLTNTNQRIEGGDERTNLVFERHGDSWVLSQVTYDGTAQLLHVDKMGKELPSPTPSGSAMNVTSSPDGN